MSLFITYIQPLTEWLQANPNWALFITFIISMAESIAIVGTIVPGSVTMTAIGILAGSGVMRVDLTLVASTLGAIAGDNVSYAIGYIYRDRIKEIWPFSRYPTWIDYGNEYFKRHGGKSVFIGRFVGPLRSLIPVIAGMMCMKQWRFFIANFFSAIGWSIGHVMPGVLIGAASHDLSPEAATKLFIIVLLVLVLIWLIGLLLKWLVIKLHYFFRRHFHEFWLLIKDHPVLVAIFNAITPKEEKFHYPTVSLLFLSILSFFLVLTSIALSAQGIWIQTINEPVFALMESFRNTALDNFFIPCSQLTSTFTLSSIIIICSSVLILQRNFAALLLLLSTLLTTSIVSYLLSIWIIIPRPQGILVPLAGSSFPNISLAIATSLFSVLVFYINNKYSTLTNTLRTVILIILGLSGLAALYLGEYWLTDILTSYLLGILICLIHWIFYRSTHHCSNKTNLSVGIVVTILFIILSSTAVSTTLNFRSLMYKHMPRHNQYFLQEDQWWNQSKPILPIYRYNRLGKINGIFNIQYLGDIDTFQEALEKNSWTTNSNTFYQDLLKRINQMGTTTNLPLFSQLYQNKKPDLFMTYQPNNEPYQLLLRLWKSNYHIENQNMTIWIGSLEISNAKDKNDKTHLNISAQLNPLTYLLPSLSEFSIRRIEIPTNMQKSLKPPTSPVIYIIRTERL